MPIGDTTQGRPVDMYCSILKLHLPRSHGPSVSGIMPMAIDARNSASMSSDQGMYRIGKLSCGGGRLQHTAILASGK